MSEYSDIRQDFWKEEFGKAKKYNDYLSAGDEKHRAKWENMAKSIAVSTDRRELIKGFTRKMNVLVLSGIWCGDCVRQGPILRKIADENSGIDLRFAERKEGSRLADELKINGALKVPVVVFLSEDYFELGRFGDRLLSVYRRMAATQLGAACSIGAVPPAGQELEEETGEWVDIFERMQIILGLSPLLRERYGS